MEWIDRLNSAIRYMEEHLTDEIDYEQLGADRLLLLLALSEDVFLYGGDPPVRIHPKAENVSCRRRPAEQRCPDH